MKSWKSNPFSFSSSWSDSSESESLSLVQRLIINEIWSLSWGSWDTIHFLVFDELRRNTGTRLIYICQVVKHLVCWLHPRWIGEGGMKLVVWRRERGRDQFSNLHVLESQSWKQSTPEAFGLNIKSRSPWLQLAQFGSQIINCWCWLWRQLAENRWTMILIDQGLPICIQMH